LDDGGGGRASAAASPKTARLDRAGRDNGAVVVGEDEASAALLVEASTIVR
jgi:hypothetical protein